MTHQRNQNPEVEQLGDITYSRGIQIESEADETSLLSRKEKTTEMLEHFRMKDTKAVRIPMGVGYLKKDHTQEARANKSQYWEAIGTQ